MGPKHCKTKKIIFNINRYVHILNQNVIGSKKVNQRKLEDEIRFKISDMCQMVTLKGIHIVSCLLIKKTN